MSKPNEAPSNEQEEVLALAKEYGLYCSSDGSGYWDEVSDITDFASKLRAKDAATIAELLGSLDAYRNSYTMHKEEITSLKAKLAEVQALLTEVVVSGEECEFDDVTQYVMPIETFQAVSDYVHAAMLSAAPTTRMSKKMSKLVKLLDKSNRENIAENRGYKQELESLSRQLTVNKQENEKLKADVAMMRDAAVAVVERWDTPLWKDVAPTADFIGRLRTAISATASSDAWLKEQKAKALEEAVSNIETMNAQMRIDIQSVVDALQQMAAYLRSPESDTDLATRLNG